MRFSLEVNSEIVLNLNWDQQGKISIDLRTATYWFVYVKLNGDRAAYTQLSQGSRDREDIAPHSNWHWHAVHTFNC